MADMMSGGGILHPLHSILDVVRMEVQCLNYDFPCGYTGCSCMELIPHPSDVH